MYTIRNVFITVLATLSLSAGLASCALDGQSPGGDPVGDQATVKASEALEENRWRASFDCAEDSNGIICTNEDLDLVVWCDYESGKCGGGCIYCN